MKSPDKLFDEIRLAAREPLPDSRPTQPVGAVDIPGYTVSHELHRGGQGVVYLALQESTRRAVAIKLILQGSFATARQRYRFESEIEIASQLRHPHIISIFEGGLVGNQPFYVMEFVSGQRLDHFAAERPTAQRDRIRFVIALFIKICRAVGYAHERGVIHRDLKPANIMVDENGEPRVLDFGLAKATDQSTAGFQPHTLTCEFVGTLDYAAPEQIHAGKDLVTARSDVFSLAAILYDLLTGAPPFANTSTVAEKIRCILEQDPRRPESRNRQISRDIDNIIMKGLSKKPQRRYENANALADDLQNYLDGAAVAARRDSKWYMFRKLLTRHRAAVAAALIIFTTLVSSLAVVSYYWYQAIEDRQQAIKANARAVEQREHAEFRNYVAHIAAAEASVKNQDTYNAVRNLTQAPARYRGFEYWHLLNQVDKSRQSLGGYYDGKGQVGHSQKITSANYLCDPRFIVSGGMDGRIIVWDTVSNQQVWQFDCGEAVQHIRCHPRLPAVIGTSANGKGFVFQLRRQGDNWSLSAKQEIHLPQGTVADLQWLHAAAGSESHAGQPPPAAPTEDRKAGSDNDRIVLVAQLAPRLSQVLVYDQQGNCVGGDLPTINDDIRWLRPLRSSALLLVSSRSVYRQDLSTNAIDKVLVPQSVVPLDAIAVHPQRQWLALASGRQITIWDLQHQRRQSHLQGHSRKINAITFSEDGETVAAASADKTLRVWRAKTGELKSVKWGHVDAINDVQIRSDGDEVITAGRLCVKLWDLQDAAAGIVTIKVAADPLKQIQFAPDSQLVSIGGNDGFYVVDSNAKEPYAEHAVEIPGARILALSQDCRRACLIDYQNQLWLLELHGKPARQLLSRHLTDVTCLCFGNEPTKLYAGSKSGTIYAWNVATGNHDVLATAKLPLEKLAVSPQGELLAGRNQNVVTVWNARSGDKLASWQLTGIASKPGSDTPLAPTRSPDTGAAPPSEANPGFDLAFSPDGRLLAGSIAHVPGYQGYDHVAVWEARTGREIAQLREHSEAVTAIAWSPDGRRLATASSDGSVIFWEGTRFAIVHILRNLEKTCHTLQFSPDNHTLAAGLNDGSIKIWTTLPIHRR